MQDAVAAVLPATPDAAANAGAVIGDVVTRGAEGNLYALVIVVIIAGAGLLGLWIWRNPSQPDRGDDAGDDCHGTGPDGCPAVKLLAAKVDSLSDQLEADRTERRDHRQEMRDAILRIHSRIDQILFGGRSGAVFRSSVE